MSDATPIPVSAMLDLERRQEAATWIAYALAGPLDTARGLLEGRSVGPMLDDVTRRLKQIEHELRTDPKSVATFAL